MHAEVNNVGPLPVFDTSPNPSALYPEFVEEISYACAGLKPMTPRFCLELSIHTLEIMEWCGWRTGCLMLTSVITESSLLQLCNVESVVRSYDLSDLFRE